LTVAEAVLEIPEYEAELEVALRAALAAGDAVRDLYDCSAAAAYIKSDGSPVTDADLAADSIIREVIRAAFPADFLFTEEGIEDSTRLSHERVWIVDPIDGTQHFIDRNGEFDVLVALVVDGLPAVGVALRPAAGTFFAAAAGLGAWFGRGAAREPFRLSPALVEQRLNLATSIWLNVSAAGPG
jgi:3'-phosphoadenosine 5'-phosphosulfate (PAPS) 3'-phosphatase